MKRHKVVADVRIVGLAMEIERLRTEDPAHYRRVMRKLAEIKARRSS